MKYLIKNFSLEIFIANIKLIVIVIMNKKKLTLNAKLWCSGNNIKIDIKFKKGSVETAKKTVCLHGYLNNKFASVP